MADRALGNPLGNPLGLARQNGGISSGIGSIQKFADPPSDDWLRTDGSAVNKEDFPKLAGMLAGADIGESYKLASFVSTTLTTIASNEEGDKLLVGSTSGNTAYRSNNYGLSWSSVNTLAQAPYVYCTGGDNFIAVASYAIAFSGDGGITWEVASGAPPTSYFLARTTAAFDGKGRVAILARYSNTHTRIYTSEDFGKTWSTKTQIASSYEPNCAAYAGNDKWMFAIGVYSSNALYMSTDFGGSLVATTSPVNAAIKSLCADRRGVVLAGDAAKIYRSSDYGDTWVETGHTSSITGVVGMKMNARGLVTVDAWPPRYSLDAGKNFFEWRLPATGSPGAGLTVATNAGIFSVQSNKAGMYRSLFDDAATFRLPLLLSGGGYDGDYYIKAK